MLMLHDRIWLRSYTELPTLMARVLTNITHHIVFVNFCKEYISTQAQTGGNNPLLSGWCLTIVVHGRPNSSISSFFSDSHIMEHLPSPSWSTRLFSQRTLHDGLCLWHQLLKGKLPKLKAMGLPLWRRWNAVDATLVWPWWNSLLFLPFFTIYSFPQVVP